MRNINFKYIENQISSLKDYNNVDNFVLGKSSLGKEVMCFHIGDYSNNQIIVEGGIHAREYISTLLIIEQIKYLSTKIKNGGIYFVPLVNPDGVELALDGLKNIKDSKLKSFLLSVNNQKEDFSLWKANIKGVDLNVNFDALWGGGAKNVKKINPENFIGFYPNSEIEVLNLIKLLNKVNPIGTLSFHSKGEVIYYGFETLENWQIIRDYMICEKLCKLNNYIPVKTERSTGGFSDYVSDTCGVPAFTVEVGSSKLQHPIGINNLNEIFNKNKDLPLKFLEILMEE